jgi:hypothetical protein
MERGFFPAPFSHGAEENRGLLQVSSDLHLDEGHRTEPGIAQVSQEHFPDDLPNHVPHAVGSSIHQKTLTAENAENAEIIYKLENNKYRCPRGFKNI